MWKREERGNLFFVRDLELGIKTERKENTALTLSLNIFNVWGYNTICNVFNSLHIPWRYYYL